jgi:Zn-finger nucleic acid-binding protein
VIYLRHSTMKIRDQRLNREIRWCTDAVGIFLSREEITSLIATVPAEQPDEWTEGMRHLVERSYRNATSLRLGSPSRPNR